MDTVKGQTRTVPDSWLDTRCVAGIAVCMDARCIAVRDGLRPPRVGCAWLPPHRFSVHPLCPFKAPESPHAVRGR